MKRNLLIITTVIFSASFAQSQQPPTASQPPPPTSGTLQDASERAEEIQLHQQRNTDLLQAEQNRSGTTNNVFNQPAGANQPQPPPFGGTNQVRFGGTNQITFGTNHPQFGGTNSGFGTNLQPGFPVNESAGAAATNRAGIIGGATNQNATAADKAFGQQMQAVMSRPGATKIFFPQTRSTISVLNRNGALTLQGIVSSEAEKQSIEARIQNTPGVGSIDNQLQVGTGAQGVTPRTPGINPAPNSQINERQLLNP